MLTHGSQVLSSLRDWARWGASRFEEAGLWYGHGTDNALSESLSLVLHALHLSHDMPPAYLDARVTPPEAERILALLQRRIDERVPLSYLTHTAWFAGVDFYINENVLVPRSPIAELIESRFEPWLAADEVTNVLDLCTGCGCIAIACAFAFVEAIIDAADISPSALEVARVNVDRHQLSDQVNLVQSDVFSALGEAQYDLIVTNPPYVAVSEMDELPEEYRHEPALGLEGGEDGLDIAIRILREAVGHLRPGGILVMEVGNSSEALTRRFPTVPFLWLEFEHGGSGVTLLTAEQLQEYRAVLMG